jgi:hypothetical protein
MHYKCLVFSPYLCLYSTVSRLDSIDALTLFNIPTPDTYVSRKSQKTVISSPNKINRLYLRCPLNRKLKFDLVIVFGWNPCLKVGRDTVVSIATCYGLDGPVIEYRWGRDFSAPVQTVGNGFFSGIKRPGRGVDHPPHLAARLKEEYSYTSTPLLGVLGVFWNEIYIKSLNECCCGTRCVVWLASVSQWFRYAQIHVKSHCRMWSVSIHYKALNRFLSSESDFMFGQYRHTFRRKYCCNFWSSL